MIHWIDEEGKRRCEYGTKECIRCNSAGSIPLERVDEIIESALEYGELSKGRSQHGCDKGH